MLMHFKSKKLQLKKEEASTDLNKVFTALLGERDYQIGCNPEWQHKGKAPVASELLMMGVYMREVQTELDKGGPTSQHNAMDMLRKVAAMCIRCFENYGTEPSDLYERTSLTRENVVAIINSDFQQIAERTLQSTSAQGIEKQVKDINDSINHAQKEWTRNTGAQGINTSIAALRESTQLMMSSFLKYGIPERAMNPSYKKGI